MRTETRVGLFVLGAIGLFFYLSVNIGSMRMDRDKYSVYKTYFNDTGGLDTKASVKIAGVEVGWVEEINLLEGGKAEVKLMIDKKNRLAKNAYAIIQQEGLIGAKSVEIDPGDSTAGYLMPGGTLAMPGKSPASIGDLLDQFRDIASSVHDVALSFRNVFATRQGEENMRKSMEGISQASQSIASFSKVLDKALKQNEESVNATLAGMKDVVGNLNKGIPSFTKDVHSVSSLLESRVLPNFDDNLNKITLAFAGDTLPKISTMSSKAGSAFERIENASIHAGEGFKQAEGVMEKINSGKGVLGKLVNEEETYTDIKKTLRGFKNYISKTQSLGLYIDMHSETMFRTTLSKGYFEVKIRPSHDYFYQVQLVADENGSVDRERVLREFRDAQGNCLPVNDLVKTGRDKLRFAEEVRVTTQKRNDILFGFQFGKRFNRMVLRLGLFENTFGAAADFYVPLKTDKLHWITSIEAFDFRGINRLNDTRAHLKWINRIYFMKNMYTAFGIDDFYSKRDASPFFGGGIRFSDDNLKYFLSMLPVGGAKR